ncbi:MAG TPA: carbamoyltransferase C-terminal domain-containing protein [Thermoanaerobaculia bacterium]|nr:carbamoyltransferase C-terminal domain-containing protein [Thermoanaerobaculia bacterium]
MRATVLGLSAFHADAAAAAVVDGRFVAGVEEERFRRVKHWAGFPEQALRWCAAEVDGGGLEGVTALAVSRQPRASLLRKAALALTHPRSLPRAAARARNLAQVGTLEGRIARAFGAADCPRLHPVEHHLAHVASAFYCSPFEEAMCLSVDGFGDFVSTMLAAGRGNRVEVLQRVHFPHSLGLLYTAVTQLLGFPAFGDEYKVMGLAAYGEPRYAAEVARLAPAGDDGGFALDLRYFRHLSEGVEMTWDDGPPALGPLYTPALAELLGPARAPDEELTDRHRDLAASLQRVYEERFFALVRALQRATGLPRLALAGGCALNSVANGKLFERTGVEEVFIQSAAGDAGTALGAALWVHHAVLGGERAFVMEHSSWGPAYGEAEARRAIAERLPGSQGADGVWEDGDGAVRVEKAPSEASLVAATAAAIAAGEVVGWHQGRSEWGPRALGNRSILADPRRGDMRDLLNRKIKRRESFRPFAPSVLEERTGDWFTIDVPDPFMLKVYPVRPEKRAAVPAVTHVDGTGRLQTVSRRANPRYWALIHAFAERTGVPMVLNTSFNENEPIVNTPAEALDCFLRTRMDRLVLGDVVVTRG